MLTFHPLTISDREAVQAVTLKAGRRNCNYDLANLVGWQFWFRTEVCVLPDAVVLRFNFEGERAYMVCTAGDLQPQLISALLDNCDGRLLLIGLEDSQTLAVNQLSQFTIEVKPRRNQYDYIYRRDRLATLRGGAYQAKRNHVKRFRAEHPDFEYRPLTPELFDECRRLSALWREEKEANGGTIAAEQRVMETVFANWDALGMTGGCIFADGRMMAFTYGAAVTTDTFDVCVEKADRHVEGAFAIINQQFAEHLSEQFTYLNREEDMGIEGLRKSKLSYHPEILLTYNAITIRKAYTLERMTADDAPLTIDWMVRQYGFSRADVEQWVRTLHFNWPLSVKALDTGGQVIGLLNMSDYRIQDEVPQIATDAPNVLASLNARRYTAVFSFIVAEPYRGTRLNYNMLMSIMPELKANYDFLFIPVLHRLKTHKYWQRWGATEFYRDTECVCYKLVLQDGTPA